MKLPVKDRTTQPYISEREIPAIKLALSAWRKLRRDREQRTSLRNLASLCQDLPTHAKSTAESIAWNLEKLSQLEERIRKEKTK